MPMRLSIGPISIGDQVSLTGDADHFPATMRRSRMAVDNSLADWGSRKGATPNRHKEASDAMIGATIGVARHVCRVQCIRVCARKVGDQKSSNVIHSSAYHLASARIGPGIG
jgi:hypothetical protein